ncbi:LORF2 protein, partial [Crocuta crocuta]
VFIFKMDLVAKLWKESKCPFTDEWIKKIYIYNVCNYYSAIKKNESFPFAMMWMELE